MLKILATALFLLMCSGLQAQSTLPSPSLDSLTLFEQTYRMLGKEMIITGSYRQNEKSGIILIEEDHTQQRNNSIFLSRLIMRPNIREIALEALTVNVRVGKALIPDDFPTEKALIFAYLFENLLDSSFSSESESLQLSNAELIYFSFDSIKLIPIEKSKTYNKFDIKLFESPRYYIQTAGVDILKKEEIDVLSGNLAMNWTCIEKNTVTLESTRSYLRGRKRNVEFFQKIDELLGETIDFNRNSMDRDKDMVEAISKEIRPGQILPVIVGASHTYNIQNLLSKAKIPFVTVMSSYTARHYASLKKRPPRLKEAHFNKHVEELILDLIISNSISDSALFRNGEYYATVCRDLKYVDGRSIQVKKRSKSQPDVIKYTFRWKGSEYSVNKKIILNKEQEDQSPKKSMQLEVENIKLVSKALQQKLDSMDLKSPSPEISFKNYENVFDELADDYVKKLMLSQNFGLLPLNDVLVKSEGQEYFVYNNYVTYNGRLNFGIKTEKDDGSEVFSGVFTRYYDHNIKSLYPETSRIFRDLHDFFNSSEFELQDLCIHIIVRSSAVKGKPKYSEEKVLKNLTRELESAKERLKFKGIKSNVFLRIDYI